MKTKLIKLNHKYAELSLETRTGYSVLGTVTVTSVALTQVFKMYCPPINVGNKHFVMESRGRLECMCITDKD